MNNKKNNLILTNDGFTLLEMLAVVTIIALLGLIAIPNVLNTIKKSTNTTYTMLVEDITIASKLLFEEIEYTDTKLYHYNLESGQTKDLIKLEKDNSNNQTITINLQTLVSNGLLTGTNNMISNETNINTKIITNPNTKEDIGSCQITITKIVDETNNYATSYEIKNNSTSNTNCPTNNDYQKVLN